MPIEHGRGSRRRRKPPSDLPPARSERTVVAVCSRVRAGCRRGNLERLARRPIRPVREDDRDAVLAFVRYYVADVATYYRQNGRHVPTMKLTTVVQLPPMLRVATVWASATW